MIFPEVGYGLWGQLLGSIAGSDVLSDRMTECVRTFEATQVTAIANRRAGYEEIIDEEMTTLTFPMDSPALLLIWAVLSGSPASSQDVALARFEADGDLDTTFGTEVEVKCGVPIMTVVLVVSAILTIPKSPK